MFPASSERSMFAATSKPSRSSPSAFASEYDSSSDNSAPFWASRFFSSDARTAGVKQEAISSQSSEKKSWSSEEANSRAMIHPVEKLATSLPPAARRRKEYPYSVAESSGKGRSTADAATPEPGPGRL